MNKQAQLVVNLALALAVAVLFFLHFRAPRAAAPVVAPSTAASSPTAADTATAPAPVETDDSLMATTPIPTPEITEASGGVAAGGVPAVRRVGFVQSGTLLDGYKGAQVARAAYEAKLKRWDREQQAAVQALQAAVQQYQAKAGSMLEGQRAETEQKLQAQEQQVAQRQQQLQQQAAEEEGKLNEQVLGKVNKLLERYGKEHDFDLILVAGNGSVAYGKPGLDLTKVILQKLNAEYAAGKK